MEASISQIRAWHRFSAPPIISKPKNGFFSKPIFCPPGGQRVLRVCSSPEKRTMADDGFRDEVVGVKKLVDERCKLLSSEEDEDDDGIVELLECLEREAIMGDDKGRDPDDYNRRALIFDKSSKVFQALKHKTSAL